MNWEVNDNLTIRSLTGYRDLDWRAYQDFAEAFGFISSTDPDFFLQPQPISFVSDNGVDSQQLSQEITFIGDVEQWGLTYVAGLYYFDEDGDARPGNVREWCDQRE